LVDSIREAKSRGKSVVIMAHRPSAIAACDLLLMVDKGVQVDFGPRDEVLKKRIRNYPQLVGNTPPGTPPGSGTTAAPVAAGAGTRPTAGPTAGPKAPPSTVTGDKA
jgi:ATP-binding cassette subfamily C protein